MSVRKVLYRLNTTIGGGAIIIAFFSIVSKLLGLYRDRLLASTFGASRITDVYFASFRIPDLIFNILVLGALTSSFIPVFQKIWAKNERDGILLSNAILNILLIIVTILSLVLFILAPWFTRYIVPGFSAAEIDTTISMTRIILGSLIFFTASNVLSGILNSWKKFLTFSLSSVVYNIGIIIGIVYLYPLYGIYGLAWGVVLGSMLHFFIQLIEAVKNGWYYRVYFAYTSSVKRIFSLMIPRTIGLAANQIDVIITTIIASLLPAGSLAVFTYANNLQSFPVGIFGVSLAVAAFPSFSKSLSDNNIDEFKRLFSTQFRRILFFVIPLSTFLLILRAQIIRVILGTGNFDWTATRLTAQTLGFFALSLTAQALLPLLARSFYAYENTKTPMIISIISIAVDVLLCVILSAYFGIIGLALAFTISNSFNMLGLLYMLHKHFGDLNDSVLIKSAGRIIFATLIAASICYLALQLLSYTLDLHTFVGIFLQGFIAGSMGICTYILISVLLHFEEVYVIRRWLSKFIKPLLNALS